MTYILMIVIGWTGHDLQYKTWTYAGEYNNLEQCQMSAKILKPIGTNDRYVCLPKGVKQ